jgi:hypothetical protein
MPARATVARAGVATLTLGLLAGAWIAIDVPSRLVSVIIVSLAVLAACGVVLARSRTRLGELAAKIQLSLASLLVALTAVEIGVAWRPAVLPAALRPYYSAEDVADARRQAVERLTETPWVKFRANTVVRSLGYPANGTEREYVYSWKTDRLGFKNVPDLADRRPMQAVAVGDSFTEGSGVATDDTWASVLTRDGFVTYNLGVQGYAPAQMAGVLARYGMPLEPRYIIIGYTTNTHAREALFPADGAAPPRFFGGIQASLAGEDMKRQGRTAVSAALLMMRAGERWSEPGSLQESLSIRSGPWGRYAAELGSVFATRWQATDASLAADDAWRRTLARFAAMTATARAAGAHTVLVYFPRRGGAYFERATGLSLPSTYREHAESHALRAFAREQGIRYVDVPAAVRAYVTMLPDDVPVARLPYLAVDGHMSAQGHALVAMAIRASLHGDSE